MQSKTMAERGFVDKIYDHSSTKNRLSRLKLRSLTDADEVGSPLLRSSQPSSSRFKSRPRSNDCVARLCYSLVASRLLCSELSDTFVRRWQVSEASESQEFLDALQFETGLSWSVLNGAMHLACDSSEPLWRASLTHSLRKSHLAKRRFVEFVENSQVSSRLGELLVGAGVLSERSLVEAVFQSQMLRKPIGEILLLTNQITEFLLRQTIMVQKLLRGCLVDRPAALRLIMAVKQSGQKLSDLIDNELPPAQHQKLTDRCLTILLSEQIVEKADLALAYEQSAEAGVSILDGLVLIGKLDKSGQAELLELAGAPVLEPCQIESFKVRLEHHLQGSQAPAAAPVSGARMRELCRYGLLIRSLGRTFVIAALAALMVAASIFAYKGSFAIECELGFVAAIVIFSVFCSRDCFREIVRFRTAHQLVMIQARRHSRSAIK